VTDQRKTPAGEGGGQITEQLNGNGGAGGASRQGATIRCSIFEHARDPKGHHFHGDPDALLAILRKTYSPRAGNPGGTPKQSMPALNAAYFPPGAARGVETAQGVSLLILDSDNSRAEGTGKYWPNPRTGEPSNRPKTIKVRIDQPVTMAEVVAQLRRAGVLFIAWTTWSCTPEWEKFRVVIFLSRPVPAHLWERASEWAVSYLGLDPFRRGLDLPVVHNPAALAFLAGSPTPETIERAEGDGVLLLIPLEALPPKPAPIYEAWEASVIADRQAEKARGEKWFQSYRVGGRPVDFRALDLVSLLQSRGIKVGQARPFKDGTKTRCHCPWASEHSNHRDGDDAVVIHTPGTWPSFRCEHSGHRLLGLRDVIEWAWGSPS
jgi:hypothetical protein